jgi:hypothetical protein
MGHAFGPNSERGVFVDEQLSFLSFSVDSGDSAPTQPQVETFDMLVEGQLSSWDGLLSRDLLNLNRMVEKQKISLLDLRAGQ